jgi:hypothetical protein
MMRGVFGRHWRLGWRLDEMLSVALFGLCVMWILAMVQGWYQVAVGVLGAGVLTLALHRQWRHEVRSAVFNRYKQHAEKCGCDDCKAWSQRDVFKDGFPSFQDEEANWKYVRETWAGFSVWPWLSQLAWAIFGWMWIERLTGSERPMWASMAILAGIGLATMAARGCGLGLRSHRLTVATVLPLSILFGSLAASIVDGMAGVDGTLTNTVGSVIAFGMYTSCRVAVSDFLLVDIRKQPSWAAQIGYFLGDRHAARACHNKLACDLHELAEARGQGARVWLHIENGLDWIICFSSILLKKLSRRPSSW